MVEKITLGQNNSLSPSPAHLSHTTNITLSRIKYEILYFYKKRVSSCIEVVIIVVYVSANICILYLYYGYTTNEELER